MLIVFEVDVPVDWESGVSDVVDVIALERRVEYEPKPLLLELLSFSLSSLLDWLLLVEVLELVVVLLLKLLVGGAETGRPIEFNDWLEEETKSIFDYNSVTVYQNGC